MVATVLVLPPVGCKPGINFFREGVCHLITLYPGTWPRILGPSWREADELLKYLSILKIYDHANVYSQRAMLSNIGKA